MTHVRKLDGRPSGRFLSREDINAIRRCQELDGIQTKRRHAVFDKSPKRTTDGKPYQAHRQHDTIYW